MTLTYKDVSEILKIIDASDCEELVLELGGTRLVVRRGGAVASGASVVAAPASLPRATSSPTPASPPPAASSPQPVAAEATAGAAVAEGSIAVRAPMVGTFYRKPSPQDPAFVEVGQKVKKGDALCLIEVMKLYTTIEAPCDGVVESIGPGDGTLVEFDQSLFSIRPT